MDSDPLYQQQLLNSNEYNYQNEKKSSSSTSTYGADRTVTCKDLPHVFVSTVGRTNDQLFVLRMTPLIDQVSRRRYTFCLRIALSCLGLSCSNHITTKVTILFTSFDSFFFLSLLVLTSLPLLYIFVFLKFLFLSVSALISISLFIIYYLMKVKELVETPHSTTQAVDLRTNYYDALNLCLCVSDKRFLAGIDVPLIKQNYALSLYQTGKYCRCTCPC